METTQPQWKARSFHHLVSGGPETGKFGLLWQLPWGINRAEGGKGGPVRRMWERRLFKQTPLGNSLFSTPQRSLGSRGGAEITGEPLGCSGSFLKGIIPTS